MKTTTRTIRESKGVRPVVCLTAYDAVTARIADAGGADLLLVGDSVGNVVLGFENTVSVTPDMMLHHIAAVARAKPKALVVGDIPFGVAHDDWTKVLGVCAEYLRAGAEAVKVEGGAEIAPIIRKLVEAGVPVMGHIGLQPQQVLALGGYRKFGKTAGEQEKLFADARAVADAGAFCIVVEMVDADFAAKLTGDVAVPVIGIGAGPPGATGRSSSSTTCSDCPVITRRSPSPGWNWKNSPSRRWPAGPPRCGPAAAKKSEDREAKNRTPFGISNLRAPSSFLHPLSPDTHEFLHPRIRRLGHRRRDST